MRNFRLRSILSATALVIASSANAALPISVSLESEKFGIQETTSGIDFIGVEDFDNRALKKSSAFMTDFGTDGAITGTYSGIEIRSADVYGGAQKKGQYAVTFDSTGYSLDLATKLGGGVTYFGFWLSALDVGNNVSFYQGDKWLFTFTAADAKSFIDGLPGRDSYYGNPNLKKNNNVAEPYAFLNFYANKGTSFDRIVFAESPQKGGYESDNHTVGRWTRKSGTLMPVTNVVPEGVTSVVPEPEAWAMMLAGFAMIGLSSRRRNRAIPA